MKTITLKITAKISIHGKRPGDVFQINCDDEGIPLEVQWRKRLADEKHHGVGAVAVITAAAPTNDNAMSASNDHHSTEGH